MSKMVTKTFTFEGKRYYVRGRTNTEAEAKRALRLQKLHEGHREISRDMKVADWAEEWIETYKEPNVNARHCKDIRGILNNYINPAIGHKSLKSVRPVQLQKILNDVSDYSSSYISKIYDVIRQLFAEAYRNSLIVENPAAALRKPSGKEKHTRRAITERERRLTLQVAQWHRGGLFILIMLYCGLRPGEVAALQWSDVDLDRQIINVNKAVKADDVVGTPKTASGNRIVPIPSMLLDCLISERGKASTPFALVCTNSRGERLTKSSIHDMWKNFKREMNIAAGCKVVRNQLVPPLPIADDLTLYCYRHTYCTDLQAACVPINVARELMGHSSIAVTAQIYTHKSDAAFNNAAKLIDAYVKRDVAQNAESLENTANAL